MMHMNRRTTHLSVDKTAFSVANLGDEAEDKAYWRGKSVYERLQAVELNRQVIYGYQPAATGFQRIFTVAEFPAG
jgi:hypothetical protein